jgi:hypothetical protein
MTLLTGIQIAYLMADVSDVKTEDLKEIAEQLDALSCTCFYYAGATAPHNIWSDTNCPAYEQRGLLLESCTRS